MTKNLLLLALAIFMSWSAKAQSSTYTLIQAGGNLGFANEGYTGAFSGVSAHLIFGKNYNDKAYLGIGVGNETFKGDYRSNNPYEPNQNLYQYNLNVLPIFVDARLPMAFVGESSKLGLLLNGGYAPAIGVRYDKGFLFKGGFFYLHETAGPVDFNLSVAYGYQQLTKNVFAKDFQHQQFNISVGIFLK